MAIYHLRASMISRSQGRSATAAIAYRVAERIEDRRTGLVFDYAKRGGVDHTEILAPDHAPDWVSNRSELWNRVEEAETRKNSQVAREVRVALPAELTHAQRIELVRDFAQEQFVDRGMVADIALHAPGRDGDDRNHHAHILLTTREIDPEGFTTKNRDWNKVELLEDWREAWAQGANLALERAGIEERIDHRTLEAQRDEALELAAEARERGDEAEELRETVRAVALDREPLPQLSAGAWQLKERGIEVAAVQVWREVKAQAVEVARVAQELAERARSWLERAAERLVPERGLAHARGRRDSISDGQDLAARMRAAWEARQDQRAWQPERDAIREPARSLAERMRAAAQGIDRDALAGRAAELQQGRQAEERQRVQDAERLKEQEQLREREEHHHNRDDGLSH
ncbi:MobQ family relaxase [Paracoccus sp. 1_MG-2023]|uniref:MobQ family relaxase n=1 Tax=unclassified Paracoccus (in: a-proteobacteria) TaxID=2688777 RepID=UPI0020918338|nr:MULTISPECIES: MobQ family relaxase [unclassified Paracoccus (in: a-proteobacteria)]MDO6670457.1 MobQ family relaxase [Paracoccus sp. 1_MG-2023]